MCRDGITNSHETLTTTHHTTYLLLIHDRKYRGPVFRPVVAGPPQAADVIVVVAVPDGDVVDL